MRGWSQTLSKDILIPWISAVQRLAKGSWPGGKLAERRVPISENHDIPSLNPILTQRKKGWGHTECQTEQSGLFWGHGEP